MKKIAEILKTVEFESSTVKTQQFKDFARTFKREFKKEFAKVGATNIVFNVGHFTISGFFTVNGNVFYFSLSDVRDIKFSMTYSSPTMLMRTAESYKDYSGGTNNYLIIGEHTANEFKAKFL